MFTSPLDTMTITFNLCILVSVLTFQPLSIRVQLETAAKASKGKVVLLLDADEAGQAATQRVVETLLPSVNLPSVELDLRVAVLPSATSKDAGE